MCLGRWESGRERAGRAENEDKRGYVDPYPRLRGAFEWTKKMWGPTLGYTRGERPSSIGVRPNSPLRVYPRVLLIFLAASFFVEKSG
eukprot:8172444-Pyramimonas_sp.AAC.1